MWQLQVRFRSVVVADSARSRSAKLHRSCNVDFKQCLIYGIHILRYLAMRILIPFILLLNTSIGLAQTVDQKLIEKEQRLTELESEKGRVLDEIENLRMTWIQQHLERLGYPQPSTGLELVKHAALTLGYSETHEQAAWVQHIVIPEVEFANVSRKRFLTVS